MSKFNQYILTQDEHEMSMHTTQNIIMCKYLFLPPPPPPPPHYYFNTIYYTVVYFIYYCCNDYIILLFHCIISGGLSSGVGCHTFVHVLCVYICIYNYIDTV